MAIVVFLAGCERDPIEWVCPELDAGDLVITEVRGEQDGADTWGEFIEIYNATGAAIDLQGLEVTQTKIDGSAISAFVISSPLSIGAGDYLVLGAQDPDDLPDHVDYGYRMVDRDNSSFSGNLYDNAAIDLTACDVLVDRTLHDNLPGEGSWSLDGAAAPDADANDDEENWCTDDIEGPTTELGAPGTPGEANRTCPVS